MTTIYATSDLHGKLPDISEVPEHDVFIVAGDISPLEYDRNIHSSYNWIRDEFSEWIRSVPAKHRLVVAGNHDFAIDAYASQFRSGIHQIELGWTYLEDTGVTIDGLKFYGTPWVPRLQGWAYYGENWILDTLYEAIPEDTDIVISHGPPLGIADNVPWYDITTKSIQDEHAGSKACRNMIERVHPKILICGHIHEGYGREEYEDCQVYNVSLNDENYSDKIRPIVKIEV